MSRSVKKTPIFKQQNDRAFKRYANKRIRHREELSNGREYKKTFETWNICDFKWFPEPGDNIEKARRK